MSHNFSEKTGLLGRIHGNFESCSYFVTIVEKSHFLLVKIVFTQKRGGKSGKLKMIFTNKSY